MMAQTRTTTDKSDRTEHTCWEGGHSENKRSWFKQLNTHRIRYANSRKQGPHLSNLYSEHKGSAGSAHFQLRCDADKYSYHWFLKWYINLKMNELHLINLNALRANTSVTVSNLQRQFCLYSVLFHQWSTKHSFTSYTSYSVRKL